MFSLCSIFRALVAFFCLFCNLCMPAAPSMPPVNLTVETTTSESITLSWSPPNVESQNGILTGYLINVTAIGTGQTFQASSTTTNITMQSLRPFTTYSFTIAAMTSAGSGPFSIPLTVQTNETGKLYCMSVRITLRQILCKTEYLMFSSKCPT